MSKLILYHGTSVETLLPVPDAGSGRRDFGKGFYLTEDPELAKEWAVCRPDGRDGYVHEFLLDTAGLKILDLQERGALAWLAELMKHRAAADSRRYRVLSEKFIAEYGLDTAAFDVVRGWRADASYFHIAKEFVRDNIDTDILERLLSPGGPGIQYCVKTEAAFSRLEEIRENRVVVDYPEFNEKYNRRDRAARKRMRELVDSDANKVSKVFSTLL